MKMYQTFWKELQYGKIDDKWSFFNDDHRVGPLYPSKELLLNDMKRYAKDNWDLE